MARTCAFYLCLRKVWAESRPHCWVGEKELLVEWVNEWVSRVSLGTRNMRWTKKKKGVSFFKALVVCWVDRWILTFLVTVAFGPDLFSLWWDIQKPIWEDLNRKGSSCPPVSNLSAQWLSLKSHNVHISSDWGIKREKPQGRAEYFRNSLVIYLYAVCELVEQLFSPMAVKERFCWERHEGTYSPLYLDHAEVAGSKRILGRTWNTKPMDTLVLFLGGSCCGDLKPLKHLGSQAAPAFSPHVLVEAVRKSLLPPC